MGTASNTEADGGAGAERDTGAPPDTTTAHTNFDSETAPGTDTRTAFDTATGSTDSDLPDGGDIAEPDTEPDAGGDGPSYAEPALVVSSPDDYWIEAEPTHLQAGDGETEVVVDDSVRYQTWDGFGGTFNEKGWEALSYLDDDERELALSLLFDPVVGARLAWGRLPIGASDYALDRYTLNDTPDDLEMAHFSIDRDREMLIPYVRAAMAHRPDLRLWAGAWTPPPWMKDNGDYDGGSLKDDPDIRAAYALYLARYVEAYQDEEGLFLDSIHLQNEPRYIETYPSCQWSPWSFRDFIRDFLGPTFADRGVSAGIWLGDLSNLQDHQYLYAVMDDQNAARYISGFGVQWYADHFIPEAAAAFPELPIMQTEHICGNPPWEAEIFVPEHPPNDHAYGEYSFDQILLYLKAGVNAYMAWNLVLDETGLSLDEARPWPQNSLMSVHRERGELTLHPAYYVFRHFSAFIDRGAVRVNADGFENCVAFENPDGTIVVVMANHTNEPQRLNLSLHGGVIRVDLPARGWATVNHLP